MLRAARPLVAALTFVGLAGLTACGGTDALSVGDVEASGEPGSTAEGSSVTVTVPTGSYDFVVADPSDEVGDLQAPVGGRLLRITSSFRDAEVRPDVWALAARAGAVQPVALTVRVGDDSYPVGNLRRGADPGAEGTDILPADLVVAVDGDLSDLSDVTLEVGYDGLTQTVHPADGSRDPGPADALYDEGAEPSDLPTADCSGGHTSDPRLSLTMSCRAGTVRQLPYVPGLGWATDGHTWTVVSLSASLERARSGATRYLASDVASDTTLEGTAPAKVLDEAIQLDGASYVGQLVFDTMTDAAVAPLHVEITWALALQSGGSEGVPSARTITYTTDVDLARLLSST
ncbi:MAG: hypothetical protein JWO76_156 [Nocardioides sp.]|nr:hypothetical protein [Nocardioides sp.]